MITTILGVGYASAPEPAAAASPSIVFSTYLGGKTAVPGGTPRTFAQNVAVDYAGNTYVTGGTEVNDLPGTANAFQPQPAANSSMSAFVAKYDPVGNLLWCTYLGGDANNMGIGVAAMPGGCVAVVGLTSSGAGGPFPTKNAFQPQYNGNADYFVSVFDGVGNLQYSTYLGGTGTEGTPGEVFSDNNSNGNNVAVDNFGLVYVTGTTSSGSDNRKPFPTTSNALQKKLAGGTDAFLTIIDPSQSGEDSLIYSSFLGGDQDDKGHSVAVDDDGYYITLGGYTKSRDFPTTSNGYRKDPPSGDFVSNGYLTQISVDYPGLRSAHYSKKYSTYMGGDKDNPRDDVYGMVVDHSGRTIVATGRTQSADFPMTKSGPSVFNRAPYLKNGTSNDQPYLVKIDSTQSGKDSLVYATFLGGGAANGDWGSFCTSVGMNANSVCYVGGETFAPGQLYTPTGQPQEAPQKLPYTQDAAYPTLQGGFDAIFMMTDTTASNLNYSTFLGGSANDRTYGLAVDPTGPNIVLSGITSSENFPVVNAAQIWPGNTGNQNAFVTKFHVPYPSGRRLGHILELLLLSN